MITVLKGMTAFLIFILTLIGTFCVTWFGMLFSSVVVGCVASIKGFPVAVSILSGVVAIPATFLFGACLIGIVGLIVLAVNSK